MKTNAEGKALIAAFIDEYDAAESRTAAEKAVNLLVKRQLNSNQFSALVSLIMGIGINGFKRSRMLALLNTRNLHSAVLAADEFGKYIYEEDDLGYRVADMFLAKQREFERQLFLKPEIVKKRKRK